MLQPKSVDSLSKNEAASASMNPAIKLSAIVPVTERFDDVSKVYFAYKNSLKETKLPYEFVYVIDGDHPTVTRQLTQLKNSGEQIKIIKLAKCFGESTALTAGFEHSSGDTIVTLPAYLQVEPNEIPRLVKSLIDHDMVVARRWPRQDSLINRIQSKAFHLSLKMLTELDFHDLGCSVRAFKRRVINELNIYGDQHRFLPLLAHRQGFRVLELDAAQSSRDTRQRVYSLGIYLRRLLDILSIFFLIKFTKKPLRFFGLLGSSIFGLGLVSLLYLTIERLFFEIPLADRPALLLSSLLVVLGIQIIAIGLVGEIIIYTHAKDLKEYTIDEIIN